MTTYTFTRYRDTTRKPISRLLGAPYPEYDQHTYRGFWAVRDYQCGMHLYDRTRLCACLAYF